MSIGVKHICMASKELKNAPQGECHGTKLDTLYLIKGIKLGPLRFSEGYLYKTFTRPFQLLVEVTFPIHLELSISRSVRTKMYL